MRHRTPWRYMIHAGDRLPVRVYKRIARWMWRRGYIGYAIERAPEPAELDKEEEALRWRNCGTEARE